MNTFEILANIPNAKQRYSVDPNIFYIWITNDSYVRITRCNSPYKDIVQVIDNKTLLIVPLSNIWETLSREQQKYLSYHLDLFV